MGLLNLHTLLKFPIFCTYCIGISALGKFVIVPVQMVHRNGDMVCFAQVISVVFDEVVSVVVVGIDALFVEAVRN